jgi:phenylacetate-CoA ligase
MNWRKPVIQVFEKHIKRNQVIEELSRLREFYSLPGEEQRRIQEARLKNLLRHAVLHVPYYRSVLAGTGVVSDGDVDLSRFRHIPFLTKDTLRQRFDRFKSDDLSRRHWYENTSGGSTGEPVLFIQDSLYSDLRSATEMVQYEWVGKAIGERHIKLWGSERDILQGGIGKRAKLSSFLRNYTLLNAFRMNEEAMAHYAGLLKRKKPKIVEAYAQSAYELAQYINSEGIHVTGVGAVITSAGNLSPFMRQEIRQAFRCQVFNRYGSREVGDMACERPGHDGLQVSLYTHLIEVVDSSGRPVQPGETGEIIVTCLSNFAMPLIRYRIGDQGVPASIPSSPVCNVDRLGAVTGRTVDVFMTADGTRVDGEYFTHLLYYRDWVRRFQVVQKSHSQIVFRIVKSGLDPPQGELDEIATKTRLVMSDKCAVAFDFVDEIPPSDSGKYRYTVSEVHN